MGNIDFQKRNLPKRYREIYKKFYKEYATSKTLTRRISFYLELWYHKKISKIFNNAKTILEIGAGSLSHIRFEKNFKKYDVVEPKEFLFKASKNSYKNLVTNYFLDIKNIPENYKYEKIISIAVLEHVQDLNELLIEVRKKLEQDGRFLVAIPAEGELLWWLAWRLTSGISFWFKYKLDYGIIMKYEHINKADYIISKLKEFFKINKIVSFPCMFKNFRLFIFIDCSLKKE